MYIYAIRMHIFGEEKELMNNLMSVCARFQDNLQPCFFSNVQVFIRPVFDFLRQDIDLMG